MCPPPQRRATRRAKYAADKITATGDVEASVRTDDARRYTADELVGLKPEYLEALTVAWADRDPVYVQDLDAARMLVALDREGHPRPDADGLSNLWRGVSSGHPPGGARGGPGFPEVTRTVTNADGSPYTYGDHAWEQVVHQPEQSGEEIRAAGLLWQSETGEWLAYTAVKPADGTLSTATGKWTAKGVVSDDLTAAGEALPAWARDHLGLPQPVIADVTAPVSRADLTATLKDLRKEIVSDDSAPDAALAYAEEISRQRLEAVGRGAATDHGWSMANRALLIRQARQRGAAVVGWFAGPRQWDKADREVLPGAVPYAVWAPVIGRSQTADDDEDGQPRERSLRDVESRVRFRAVAVFDYSQTRRKDGAADPDWQPSLPGGDEELYERMVAASPIPVVEDHAGGTGRAHGWTDGRKILLDARRSVGSRIETLAHEYAHVQGDHLGRIARGEMTREHAEQEAGLAAYLVVRQLGLGDDSDKTATGNAAAYLRSWATPDGGEAAGHKQRWRKVTERLTPATEAAQVILARFLGLDRTEPAEAAARA